LAKVYNITIIHRSLYYISKPYRIQHFT